jgi:hypothetical protein
MATPNTEDERVPRSWLVPAAILLIVLFVVLMWVGWVWLVNLPGG